MDPRVILAHAWDSMAPYERHVVVHRLVQLDIAVSAAFLALVSDRTQGDTAAIANLAAAWDTIRQFRPGILSEINPFANGWTFP